MGADYQTLHQLDRSRRERVRLMLAERALRAERRVRELEKAQGELLDLLEHERGRNRALVMEIEAWRANERAREGR